MTHTTQFYVSIIFIGILLMAVSLFLVLLDRKKSYDHAGDIKGKIQELSNIMNDAEQMIQELNKFSDYVVNRIDEKNQELGLNLKKLEEATARAGLNTLNEPIHESLNVVDKASTPIRTDRKQNAAIREEIKSDVILDSLNLYPGQEVKVELSQPAPKDKLNGLSAKHREILRLAESGMNQNEIARQLKVGKGEIELVMGLNKQ